MAVRTILQYPDKRLRQPAAVVTRIDETIERLIDDLAETMYATPSGVGLAATQIGEPFRVFVIDLAEEGKPSELRAFVNPEITYREGTLRFSEGCLSFPGVREDIDRALKIRVKALDRAGTPIDEEHEGFPAVAIQHETDHLHGVLLIDHLGPLKRRLLHRKLVRRAELDR